MTSKIEREFLILFQFIIDTAADVVRDFTETKIGRNIKQFADKFKHQVFHLYHNKNTLFCICPPEGCKLPRTGKMDNKTFRKLYFYDEKIRSPKCHVSKNCTIEQKCICPFVASNVKLEDLDVCDINYLLGCYNELSTYNQLSKLSKGETESLGKIMEIRGNVCHAIKSNNFSEQILGNMWNELEISVLALSPPSATKYIERNFSLTKQKFLSEDEVQRLLKENEELNTNIKQKTEDFRMEVQELKAMTNDHHTALQSINRTCDILLGVVCGQPLIANKVEINEEQTDYTFDIGDNKRKLHIKMHNSSLKRDDERVAVESMPSEVDVTQEENRSNNDGPQSIRITSKHVDSIILDMITTSGIFRSPETLRMAIVSIIQKTMDSVNVENHTGNVIYVEMTFGPLTSQERESVFNLVKGIGGRENITVERKTEENLSLDEVMDKMTMICEGSSEKTTVTPDLFPFLTYTALELKEENKRFNVEIENLQAEKLQRKSECREWIDAVVITLDDETEEKLISHLFYDCLKIENFIIERHRRTTDDVQNLLEIYRLIFIYYTVDPTQPMKNKDVIEKLASSEYKNRIIVLSNSFKNKLPPFPIKPLPEPRVFNLERRSTPFETLQILKTYVDLLLDSWRQKLP